MRPYVIDLVLLLGISSQISKVSEPPTIQLVDGDEVLVIRNMDADLRLLIRQTDPRVEKLEVRPRTCRWGPFEISLSWEIPAVGVAGQQTKLELEFAEDELKRLEEVLDRISKRIKELQAEKARAQTQKVAELLEEKEKRLVDDVERRREVIASMTDDVHVRASTEDDGTVRLYRGERIAAEFSIKKSFTD